jgi:hypothetical protein
MLPLLAPPSGVTSAAVISADLGANQTGYSSREIPISYRRVPTRTQHVAAHHCVYRGREGEQESVVEQTYQRFRHQTVHSLCGRIR